MALKLQKDLSEFVGLLLFHDVEFLLVGGHALAFHGAPRFTEDIDFLILSNPGNASKLMEVMADFGFSGTMPVPLLDVNAWNHSYQKPWSARRRRSPLHPRPGPGRKGPHFARPRPMQLYP